LAPCFWSFASDTEISIMPLKHDQHEDSICLHRCAAASMMLGPGAAMGFYSATSGYYITLFDRPDFFMLMVAAILFPGALVSLLQYQFDAYFDRLFSTSLAFFVRVVVLQIVLAGVGLVWVVRPQCPHTVLCVGALLGFISLAIISSSTQMIAAMDPQLTVYSTIGRMLGSLLPVVGFFVLGFSPESSMATFRTAISAIPVICLACCSFLSYLHASTDMFQKSYDRLSDDLWHVPADLSLAEKHEATVDTDTEASVQHLLERRSSESSPLLRDGDDVPSWIWIWCSYTGLSTMMSVTILGVVGFFGSAALAQTLSLSKLVTEFAGVFMSMPWPQFPSFKQGPWHKLLAAGGLSCAAQWLVLLYKMFNHSSEPSTLLLAWIGFYLIHSAMLGHISVTIGSFVSVKDRKRVLRTNVACQNVGLLAGVSLTFAIAMQILTGSSAVSLLRYAL